MSDMANEKMILRTYNCIDSIQPSHGVDHAQNLRMVLKYLFEVGLYTILHFHTATCLCLFPPLTVHVCDALSATRRSLLESQSAPVLPSSAEAVAA